MTTSLMLFVARLAKISNAIALFIFLCLLTGGCRSGRGHALPTLSFALDRIPDKWTALSERDGILYQLQLGREGSGNLAVVDLRGTLTHVALDWTVKDGELHISFERSSNRTDFFSMRCFVHSERLQCVLVGRSGWTERLVFWRRSSLYARLQQLNGE